MAGYAIAIPVDVIAVLLLETGMRRGFRPAAAAAAGGASADAVYAILAVAFGAALAGIVAPVTRPVRAVAVVALVVLAARGLMAARARVDQLGSGLPGVRARSASSMSTPR